MSVSNYSTKRHSDVTLRTNGGSEFQSGVGTSHRRTMELHNYPEHLNPFYKDDNHKRIRFMKVLPKKLQLSSSSSSTTSNKPRSERRSSFSMDGIKEIWKLRPFRSGNKKPMPTTVTKTSESPPQLRAAMARDADTFRDVPFQRNHRVRASMSEVNNNGSPEEYFSRNTRYRCTMGAVPPTTSPVMKQGSSQLSVRSTNPFEDDMDDDMISVSGYSVASMPNRPYRKKRRAPLPPTRNSIATNKTDDDKATTNPRVMVTMPSTDSGSTSQVELLIAEKATEQIQSIASEIDALIRRTESRESVLHEEDKKMNGHEFHEDSKCDIITKADVEKNELNGKKHEVDLPAETKTCKHEQTELQQINGSEQEPPCLDEDPKLKSDINSEPEKTKVEIDESTNPLRIVESEDEETIPSPIVEKVIVTSTSTAPMQRRDPYMNVVSEMEKYDVRYVPLKGAEGEEPRPQNGQTPKTVKDIIESINKSQSLLKINVEEQQQQRRTSNASINTRIRDLERNLEQKETVCKEMLSEIELDEKIGSLAVEEKQEVEIPVVIQDLQIKEEEEGKEREEQVDDVNELFKKCRPSSASPTSSPTTADGNPYWNPLPKPKRSNNSSPSTYS